MGVIVIGIHEIIKNAVDMEASDIHLTPGLPPVIRVLGQLKPIDGYDPLPAPACDTLISSLMSEEQSEKYKKTGEVDFSYPIPGTGRVRVNVFRQRRSTAAAIHILAGKEPDIDALGLPQCFKEYMMKPRGLFLITGPTGSGKSTTLAAMINHANRNRRCHILTIEDPIEYLYKHDKSIVNQREIGDDTGSFTSALRAGMREDPDIILVGEMRDLETMATALTAAETGHLVLSTLHTTSAPLTVDRIIDMFPATQQQQVRSQLSSVLQCIATQQLVPSRDGSGRLPVFELLVFTDAIRALIRDGKTHMIANMMQTGITQGMMPMDYSLSNLVKADRITMEDAGKCCQSLEMLKRYLSLT